jgi:putative DNA primase/helicase
MSIQAYHGRVQRCRNAAFNPTVEKPRIILPCTENIPAELRERQQWVGWRYGAVRPSGKREKVPIDARTGRRADVTDPRCWSGYGVAMERCNTLGLDGVGYAFSPSDPYFGLDADDCLDAQAGALTRWAEELVRDFATYTDISPSGAGVKLIGRGKLPGPGVRKDPLELYDSARYFCLTGRLLPGAPAEIRDASAAAANLYRLLAEKSNTRSPVAVVAACSSPEEDDDLIQRAGRARNGAKFLRLWSGDWSGYPSHSEGDLALCCILAFWCGPDPDRIARLFSWSGLARPKWARRDYQERTIAAALRGRAVFWRSPSPIPTTPGGYGITPPAPPTCVLCESHLTYPAAKVDKRPGDGGGVASLEALAELAFRRWPLGNPEAREEGDLFRLSLLCEGMAGEGGVFCLSTRLAARLLLMSQSTAARRLHRLVDAGELVLEQKGTFKTGWASVYRYKGPSLSDLAEGCSGT